MPCQGDSTSTCGAAWLLSLYAYNETGLPACSGSVAATPATVSTTIVTSATVSAMTVTSETVSAATAVSTLDPGSASPNATDSNATVTGSATLLSSNTGSASSSTLSSTTRTSITIPVSASSTISSTASPLATYAIHTDSTDLSEWYSLGCAVDSATRILGGYSETSQLKLTIDGCLSMCEDKGYSFAGVEFGEECYCGSSIPTTITYSDGNCNVACTGDSTEMCGGGWGLDLYELVSSASASSCEATATGSLTVGNAIALPVGLTVVAGGLTVGVGPSSASVSTKLASITTSPPATKAASVTVIPTATTSASVTDVVNTASGTTAPADPTTVPTSGDTHNVWGHHMVGNTYPYTQANWLSDIQAASSYGIDGFALNMGSDSWQPARIADAYAAAASSGTGFKLFLSLDMTSLSCASSSDAANLVGIVKQFASSSAQAMHNGKILVSTFAGSDCTFGTGSSNGWQGSFVNALSSQGVDIFFVPSLFSDISTFSSNTWMDGELNWNSGWPSGGSDIATAGDTDYMAALGSKEYMPAISPFFYTHFGANSWNKNWLYRGDDWLYCTRWEQVIAMRESVKMAEILTWNDYGESSYIGPIEGALPAGSDAWVDGFDHTGINVLTKYYATAFKTGSYPTITADTIIMWSRPHPHDATASDDSVGQPTGWDWTDDYLYAVVLAQSNAIVSLTSGSNTASYSVSAGLTKLKIASSPGSMSAQMTRSGNVVASYSAGSAFTYTDSPSTYNFNYMVGSSS